MKFLYPALLVVTSGLALARPVLEPLVTELDRPIDMATTTAFADKFYVAEQGGVILAVDAKTGERLGTVLDISSRTTRDHNEKGLLGVAFDPANPRTFYVNYNEGTSTHISRFQLAADGMSADEAGEERLLTFEQDYKNHNGGWMGFGPDGYLYIGIGDGGAANDPKARAQDNSNLLGTIARIDVSTSRGYEIPSDNPFADGNDGRPEIYAYGLRNPWRCSFDRKTGDLWIGDVGQNAHEEINYARKGKANGVNYGWRPREGKHATPKKGVGGKRPAKATDPIYEYDHGSESNQGRSVTGGFVYHGSIQDFKGRYFFADFVNPRIWTISQKRGKVSSFSDLTEALSPDKKFRLGPVSSFAEDLEGELYVITLTGTIYRITDKG